MVLVGDYLWRRGGSSLAILARQGRVRRSGLCLLLLLGRRCLLTLLLVDGIGKGMATGSLGLRLLLAYKVAISVGQECPLAVNLLVNALQHFHDLWIQRILCIPYGQSRDFWEIFPRNAVGDEVTS